VKRERKKEDIIGLVIARANRIGKEISIPHGEHSSSLNANRRNNEKRRSIDLLLSLCLATYIFTERQWDKDELLECSI